MDITERFLKYVSFDTQSDEQSHSCPSTEKQLVLGEYLKNELLRCGAADVSMDENGYVYGTVPASEGSENMPAVAFLAHMDTSGECSGKDVKARIIRGYDGGDIVLNEELGIITDVKNFPNIKNFAGQDIIVTDGTTLLGADDKAGIAVIMSAVEAWTADKELKHPEIRVIFTPDEETGRGVDRINMDKVNAACGYTIDGADAGEISYECFNASSAAIDIHGVSVHPGESFGIMKNASLLAMEFNAMLPPMEVPAATVSRMGFYHLTDMKGDVENAQLRYILRDHSAEGLLKRKALILSACDYMNKKYGDGTFSAQITDGYRNMIEKILPHHAYVIENAREAIKECGLTPNEDPVRGGTDGAALSYMGLPCPNLGAGGQYFHGVHELLSIQGMKKAVDIIMAIARKMA